MSFHAEANYVTRSTPSERELNLLAYITL